MNKLVLKKGTNGSKKTQPHIMIVGRQDMQQVVAQFLDLSISDKKPIVEQPSFADVERFLGQLEPTMVIVTNYKMGLGLTLQKIIARVPVSNIVVMCDEVTLPSVIPTGVHVTTTKMHMEEKLLPIINKILEAQGY